MNRIRTVGIGVVALGAVVGLGAGCQGDQSGRGDGAGERQVDRVAEYEGPPVSLDSSGREHVIVAQAPSPGWRLDVDAVQATREGRIVYATLRRPDPERMYAQVITPKRLGTTVPSDQAIELAMRIVSHDGAVSGPYRPAARAE